MLQPKYRKGDVVRFSSVSGTRCKKYTKAGVIQELHKQKTKDHNKPVYAIARADTGDIWYRFDYDISLVISVALAWEGLINA